MSGKYLLEEIRLNESHATRSFSEYDIEDPDLKGDSKPITNTRVIRTDSLIKKLQSLNDLNRCTYKVDHLFPPNCRYFEEHPNGYFVVIEEPPSFRTITTDMDVIRDMERLKTIGVWEQYGYQDWEKECYGHPPYYFTLGFPYTIFFLSFSKVHNFIDGRIFFRTKPISGFADALYKAPLSNINSSQSMCFGGIICEGPHKSIFADVQYVLNSFWTSTYNSDYIYNIQDYAQIAGLCDYFTWQYYSDTNPLFIYTADWIPAQNSVGEEIDICRNNVIKKGSSMQSEITYKTISSLFTTSVDAGRKLIPGTTVTETLIYDIAQSTDLFPSDLGFIINVGDTFCDKNNKRYYIESFLGFRQISQPSFIELQTEDGKVLRWKLTTKTKEYIKERILEDRYVQEVILPNGETLKSGHIIKFKNTRGNEVYRKIMYIRLNVNGELEARAGSEFYILTNLPEDVKVMSFDSIEYYGIKLSTKENYIIIKSSISPNDSPICKFQDAKYIDINTDVNQNLVIELLIDKGRSKRGEKYSIPFKPTQNVDSTYSITTNDTPKLFKKSDLKPLPPVFNIGRRIMRCHANDSDTSSNSTTKTAFSLHPIGVAYTKDYRISVANYRHYKDEILKNDVFHIESSNLVLHYEIGDKVVVANWQDPLDMLTVKTIQGFVYNQEYGDIRFILIDKTGKLSEVLYVKGNNSFIAVGRIRKITNEWGELRTGMKINANVAGISMFPKKDTNIIIGFLYDTGGAEPLVLCSNACTLWYQDVIEKFDRIPMDHPDWQTKQHASINPSKMRYQSGDIIKGRYAYTNEFGYMVFIPHDQRAVRATGLSYYADHMDTVFFDKYFTEDVQLDCFPNPRLSVTQEDRLGLVSAFPNFHGMYSTIEGGSISYYQVPNDPRSIINVPSDNS